MAVLRSLGLPGGHEAVIRLLLERGALIDVTDKHGRTPLSLAAGNGHEAIVRLLLEKEGVDKNSRSTTAFDGGRYHMPLFLRHRYRHH
jgi:ankyrin repeat protein